MENLTDEAFTTVQSKEYSYSTFIEKFAQDIDLAHVRNSKQQTLLHIAAGYGKINLISYLVSKGADVNALDETGQAPLHSACCHGHYTASIKLIVAGAYVDLADHEGWTPMHFACARRCNSEKIDPKYMRVIELLVKSGADPYSKTKRGRICISRFKNADDRREIRIMHLLLKLKNLDNNTDRENLIDSVIDERDIFELVKIGDENIDLIDQLITHRLVNSRLEEGGGISPLHRASGYNHLKTACLLVERGAIVDAIDDLDRIPLHNAAQYGHVEMIEFLISKSSHINHRDCNGYSPLHVAARNKTFTACLKLIELGANVNLKCNLGQLPYDLAESNDVKEVLKPDTLSNFQVHPSSSDQGYYIQLAPREQQPESDPYVSPVDNLMLDSSSNERLFNKDYPMKKVLLDEGDWRYQLVKNRMVNSIVPHAAESCFYYPSYDIISIEQILNKNVWSKYRLMCKRLELDVGLGKQNEKLLFHGSNFIDNIEKLGFDERYAQRNGMFGAGIYFAKHSSKSNQYTFGWGQGCPEHMDKSCNKCERKMIYAQVALGKSCVSKKALPDIPHAPPGFHSVTGDPKVTEDLMYPEYVIYNGDQAYPLYVIRYRIKSCQQLPL